MVMTYRGDDGGRRMPPPRPGGRPRDHQRAQMMPLPGRGQSPYDERTRPMGTREDERQYAPPPPPRRDPPRPDEDYPPSRPPRRRRRWSFGRILLTLVLVFVVFLAGIWVYLEFSIKRVDALTDYSGRPVAASGTNWLIVGSDSREGLTAEDEERLATGDVAAAGGGQRTDTIMVAHIPDNSTKPTLLSLPRDSQVKIPGHGTNKINAAFSLGGPTLLAQTVEGATGLHIDHYAEIGFGGFAKIVDAIGGVDMCIDKDMNDTMTGISIKAGCQSLDGRSALGFVRMRHSDATPRSDLDRVANQRKFIGALVSQIASPGTLLNPFHFFPLLGSGPDALTMDSGDHVHNLAGLAIAMRGISSGGVVTTTVPVTNGSAENWDAKKSKQLFDALKNDTEIPDSVIVN
ncbi:cell envelope-related function transcriptional attenuator common domain-containing protein [Amycolatopsis pretoriensis]|uniref:Cell envelope-related function transcriptional attenuator common domain-containing protein n=1 Tax=Amycolatopsis pretoriensis TaxID=218821 RepID=A0A1H5RJK4_9PSEU|nr:LCP family protein [Amycolatopsis pretoriensis]SEF37707.1 cell envelope-related function transcriptional attenuator common domain-containing protein [Amycolatopsis pretoriensis]